MLSSHLVADLERVCDYIVGLAHGRTVLADELETILAGHRLLTGARQDIRAVEQDHLVLRQEDTRRQTNVWVQLRGPVVDPRWEVHELSLEDIILTYLGQTSASMPAFATAGGDR
jgi:ABC-2 type transport system ATP-binding protein